MAKFVEMDDKVTLSTRMEQTIGPVFLVNKIDMNPNDMDRLSKAGKKDATIIKQQSGFISVQLYRDITRPTRSYTPYRRH